MFQLCSWPGNFWSWPVLYFQGLYSCCHPEDIKKNFYNDKTEDRAGSHKLHVSKMNQH